MATLSAVQVAAAAYLGGFRGNQIAEAVAVARGESSFRTDKCTSQYCGLWQIGTEVNKSHLHGDWRDPVVNAKAAKELVSARGWCGGRASNGHCQNFEAYGLSNAGMSWSAKMAEGQRAYAELTAQMQAGKTPQQVLGTVSTSAQNADWDPKCLIPGYAVAHPGECKVDSGDIPGVGGILDVGQAIINAIKAPVEFANRIGRWISDPDNWMRVAEVLGGGMLLALGLRVMFNKQVVAATRQIASTVLPTGKASKAVQVTRKLAT